MREKSLFARRTRRVCRICKANKYSGFQTDDMRVDAKNQGFRTFTRATQRQELITAPVRSEASAQSRGKSCDPLRFLNYRNGTTRSPDVVTNLKISHAQCPHIVFIMFVWKDRLGTLVLLHFLHQIHAQSFDIVGFGSNAYRQKTFILSCSSTTLRLPVRWDISSLLLMQSSSCSLFLADGRNHQAQNHQHHPARGHPSHD
jgi:hypothetical protein